MGIDTNVCIGWGVILDAYDHPHDHIKSRLPNFFDDDMYNIALPGQSPVYVRTFFDGYTSESDFFLVLDSGLQHYRRKTGHHLGCGEPCRKPEVKLISDRKKRVFANFVQLHFGQEASPGYHWFISQD